MRKKSWKFKMITKFLKVLIEDLDDKVKTLRKNNRKVESN